MNKITELDQIHYCWRDLILDDKFGITEEDWNAVIQETVEHIHSWTQKDIKGRVSGIVDFCCFHHWRPYGKEKPVSLCSGGFRWLPCKSLKGATVADHALTASAIAYCLAYDLEPRPDIETLDKLPPFCLDSNLEREG